MIDIASWMDKYLKELDDCFGDRVWFVGLQGSYGRGEATETSDIDVVAILDKMSAQDVRSYREMLDALPHRELICGFLSGRNELLNWEPSDLFQFFHDTKPVRGSMEILSKRLDRAAVGRAIRTGACNIFHGCVHNMVHDRSGELLQGLYKAAVFTMQAICFRRTGRYFSRMDDLAEAVLPDERAIVETAAALKGGAPVEFEEMSDMLLTWAQKWIGSTDE